MEFFNSIKQELQVKNAKLTESEIADRWNQKNPQLKWNQHVFEKLERIRREDKRIGELEILKE